MKLENNLKIGAVISYVISLLFIGMGFYKMFVYYNPESVLLYPGNAYVGSDAYNYTTAGKVLHHHVINVANLEAAIIMAGLKTSMGILMKKH